LSHLATGAFENCPLLESICIPSSVRKLGRHCFSGCQNLSTVSFESGSQLSSAESPLFEQCPSLSAIRIPRSLQHILHGRTCGVRLDMTVPEKSIVSRDKGGVTNRLRRHHPIAWRNQ
jgi:hypothetical protein